MQSILYFITQIIKTIVYFITMIFYVHDSSISGRYIGGFGGSNFFEEDHSHKNFSI